jgi:phenylalanine-4-hydroxylase
MEILEILELENYNPALAREIRIDLELKASNQLELSKLIYNGFYLIGNAQEQLTNNLS